MASCILKTSTTGWNSPITFSSILEIRLSGFFHSGSGDNALLGEQFILDLCCFNHGMRRMNAGCPGESVTKHIPTILIPNRFSTVCFLCSGIL